jgi:hypothetical protein
MLKEIQTAGLDNLWFSWYGVRNQALEITLLSHPGTSLIIEYDNTQNNANHVHTVVRDLKHDLVAIC